MTIVAVPTVRGEYRFIECMARGAANWPASWNWHLATAAPVLDKTTVTLSEATQSSGGGYSSSGYALAQNSTDFPTWDWYDGVAQIGSFTGGYTVTKQLSLTASGGDISFRYWMLCDDAAVGSREIYLIGDAGQTETISDGRTAFIDVEIRKTV